ncbi:MAG: hypothetical protein ACODAJ_00455 [Planctomycetota bacterium]
MPSLPLIPFGDVEITRLVSGGNPLCGNSHFSPQRSEAMRAYFTDERVVEYLQRLEAAGINTLQARGDYHRVLHWVELHRRRGGRLHWIAQTASEMHDVNQNIRVLATAGAVGVYHHGARTDNWWLDGHIDRVEDRLKCMRDCGVQVGLGTHTPEVIDYAEERGWDLDFYMTCLYNLNRQHRESALVAGRQDVEERFYEEDPPAMCQRILATDKTCLAFKILAAGRRCGDQDQVRAAFRWAFAHIKPTDALVVGMFPRDRDEIALNVQHALAACQATSQSQAGDRESCVL